ncbi:MAG: chitobiase/beta-hexosaminidase C-terminal domain-containing protein [Acidobacteriota bacterium]|nr:chitobiase/beta-hexosaminidase C-terminal domain-containing protein [Acidobacteriota bacterium]
MNLLKVKLGSKVFQFRLLLASIMVLSCFAGSFAQTDVRPTTVTVSNGVQAAGIDRPGINLGGLTAYGPQQLFKSLNYAAGGYMPGTYWASTFQCSPGGPNTTTSWYNNITNSNGYPDNWWVGATFVAINSSTGTSYGSGTITASTANTGSSGTTFTLSPAISSACNASQSDVLIVRLSAANSNYSPNQMNAGICASATWNTADTSPSSTNTIQSLETPNGCRSYFSMDQVLLNATNTNSTLAGTYVPWINLNGTYTATFKAKCLVSGCSIGYNVGRIGSASYVATTTVNPVYNPTPGQGWTTYTKGFTATETGSQTTSLSFGLVCNGTCLIQDVDVIEGSTMAANSTVFRDAVVYELQKIHPGSIRYMDGTQWCSDVEDQIASTGNRRWCGASEYVNWLEGPPIGYNDILSLANLIGSDAWISVGLLNQASDWTTLVNWLNTSGWTSTFAASGHKIYLEDGNEAWNTGVPATLFQGNGTAYGYTLGRNMAAAKAASGYNSGVIKLVANGWAAGTQGYGAYGWLAITMQAAGCTSSSGPSCPDLIDTAPYTLDYLGSFDTSRGAIATTGAPFLDQWAELSNLDSITSPPIYATSMYLNQQYAKSKYGLNTAVYEVNEGTTAGIAATQLQLDQADASVGSGLATAQHILLMQRDALVTGPIHAFTLANTWNRYNNATNAVIPLWGTAVSMATGPGQNPGSANVDRPVNIALEIINNAIGSNNNLMSITQSGTPTFSYAGGQPQAGTNTILANPAVPYVNCFAFANDAQTSWTTICFNNNLKSSETVTLAGVGAPSSSVTQTVFPGSGNVITDHNENTYVGPSSIPPVVTYPSSTSTTGSTYSIPPASMIVLTYDGRGIDAGPTPTLTTPVFSPGTGTFTGTQTVTISFPSGSTGCVGINTTPTSPIAGTCGPGGTTYTGPITVSSSETLNAIATEAGNTNSAPGVATYTIIEPTVAAPSFSPSAGTYTSSQTVAIGTSTPGATIYYTTDGSTPTTSSPVYANPITVAASETVRAIATASGYQTSAVGSATYSINTTPVVPPSSPSPVTSPPIVTTPATNGTPPYVGYVAVWGINNSNATVTWSTDVPATAQLVYGTTPALGQLSPLQTDLANNHGVTLTGLNPGTTYYFVARSTDMNGNTGYSTTSSFKTIAGSPTMSGVTVSPAGNHSATISWTTSAPTNSYVQYGTSAGNYTFYSKLTSLTASPQCILTYVPSGTIHYQLVSADANGNMVSSPDSTFIEP